MSVEVTVLDNGLTVATHAMPHLESAALGVFVASGSRAEEPQEHGVSHLLEHMAFKGTRTRSARDIAETIEAVGGEINAATSVEDTAYYVRLLKGDVELGLEVLSDILVDSRFDAEELKRERQVILQEIGAVLDTPEERVFDQFQETAYPGQAIGRPILGTPDSVAKLDAPGLRRFLGETYRGSGMVLAAAGAVDHGRIAAAAERLLSGFPRNGGRAPQPARYRGGERIEAKDLEEAQILIGFEAPSRTSPERHTGQLLASVLGGGMASRLFQEARESRGLCYSIEAFHWPFSDTGLFGVHAATGEEVVGDLAAVVLDELVKLSDGVREAEIVRAKAQMRAGLLMILENPAARAGQMARHILTHGRPLGMGEILERIEAVEAADVAALAARAFASPPTLAATGPVRRLPRVEAVAARLGGRLAA